MCFSSWPSTTTPAPAFMAASPLLLGSSAQLSSARQPTAPARSAPCFHDVEPPHASTCSTAVKVKSTFAAAQHTRTTCGRRRRCHREPHSIGTQCRCPDPHSTCHEVVCKQSCSTTARHHTTTAPPLLVAATRVGPPRPRYRRLRVPWPGFLPEKRCFGILVWITRSASPICRGRGGSGQLSSGRARSMARGTRHARAR
jgi:hypothetical protein